MLDGGPAALNAAQADRFAVLLALVALGSVAWVTVFTSPRRALVAWLLVIAFVPVWWGLNLGVYLLPGTVIGLMALISLRNSRPGPITFTTIAVFSLFAATMLTVVVPGGWSIPLIFTVLTQWVVGFLIGRLAPGAISLDWIYRVVTVIMAVAGALAILEFVLAWNPWVLIPGDGRLFNSWSELQERGGIVRAEGAFGHSIALGASLAMSIPVALSARFSPPLRIVALLMLVGGSVVSFSRIGVLGCIIAIVLSLYALPSTISRRLRLGISAVGVVGVVALFSFVSDVFDSSGEAVTSAVYRGDLVQLVPEIEVLGRSGSFRNTPDGGVFGGFESIDNAVLLLGLRYGWIPLAIALGLMAVALVVVLLRRSEPPLVAVVSQFPALFTVALITQFSLYFWFMAGLAVAAQAMRSSRSPAAENPDDRSRATDSPEDQEPETADTHPQSPSAATRLRLKAVTE